MGRKERVYDFTERLFDDSLVFIFISKGIQDVVKAVEYNFVTVILGMKVYNLGFGNYNFAHNNIIDDIDANNGDAYRVFYTVLDTIPPFFERFNDCIVMVQGSDAGKDFSGKCRLSCRRNCVVDCKKYRRRINLYGRFVDSNYETLISDYEFIGGMLDEKEQMQMEWYKPGRKYDVIMFYKKMFKFGL